LWGPVGLILSAPLTVVLLVLGKHVPQVEFLDVMLGDEPVLEPNFIYYQRLLARDQDEAAELVMSAAKTSSAEEVYDALLVPSLNYAKRDRQRDELSESDQRVIFQTTQDVMEDLGERRSNDVSAGDAAPAVAIAVPVTQPPIRILACPARDEADRLALLMLRQLLDPLKWEVEVTAVETLTSELVARVAQEGRVIVCVGSLPPGGLAHTRYLCKRLRARFPRIKIIVGRWGLRGNVESNQEQLQEAGADLMGTTILETRRQLESWNATLAHEERRAVAS
jgi:hypothetical protein